MYCIGRGSNAKRGGVVGRMRVDSGAVQCHVLTRARVGEPGFERGGVITLAADLDVAA